MRAFIVIDLGFGDSGKGLLTDFLVRRFNADVVVRYNGGAQAGHNVVTPNGHHHTFSQFGSGTFIPNVKTYLSRHVVVHPQALLIEGNILEKKGVRDPFSRLRLSDQTLITTPFHQAANRIREIARGANRHGSCGVGVGETVEDAYLYPENRILAGDLNKPTLLQQKLSAVREQKLKQIAAVCKNSSHNALLAKEYEIFEQGNLIDTWIASVTRISELGLVVSDSVLERWLRTAKNVIFEGAQGILLDEGVGFHPFTTWSRCTTSNAFDLIKQMVPDADIFKIGVLRSYAVRHGPGPLPTETDVFTSIVSEHNKNNEWQGSVRYGWFDAVLARYALAVSGGVDSLAVTHLDVISRLKTWKYCHGYKGYQGPSSTSVVSILSDGLITDFRLSPSISLTERTRFTQALSKITPVFKTCNADDDTVLQEIELIVGQKVEFFSCGPSAEDVRILN